MFSRFLWLALSLEAAAAPAPPPAAGERLLCETPLYRVWVLYPPEKVLKLQTLSTAVRADAVELRTAKGEYEPFVLALRPRGRKPLLDVRILFESPAPAGPGRIEFSCERVGYVHVTEPSGTSVFPDTRNKFLAAARPFGGSGRVGFFPDRLLPFERTEAPPGENTQFWITARIPRRAAAGPHEARLRLKARGAADAVIPLRVAVFDFALPRRSSLRNTTWWNPNELKGLWGEKEFRALYRDMAAHRQAPDPILPQPGLRIDKRGDVSVDTAAYDKMLSYCLDELGVTHFFFPRAGGAWYTNIYWIWHTPAARKQRWYGVPIFQDDLSLTPQFRHTFGQYVKKMADHFRRRGWLGKVYMTTMDEPQRPDDFKAIRSLCRFVKSIAPEIKMFCTAYPRPELLGCIDAWCPQQYDEAAVRARQALGEEFMFYKNWLHLTDMPIVDPRLEGWIAWRTRAAGWLTYATMGRWRRAWDEPYAIYANTGIKAWGLGLWWYPDLLRARVLKSVRWEMMREGAEDYEYLALLTARLNALPADRRGSPAARGAREFLNSAASKIFLCPAVLPGGRDKAWRARPWFTRSHREVWALRNRAAEWIQRLPAVAK